MAILTTQSDINIRLWRLMCYIGEEADRIENRISTGSDCSCDIKNLKYLVAASEIIGCYVPKATASATDVCLSETQINTIFDVVSEMTGLCFDPPGLSSAKLEAAIATEEAAITGADVCYLLLEDGDYVLLEDGSLTVLEHYTCTLSSSGT